MLRRPYSNRRGFIRSALAVPGVGVTAQSARAQRKRRPARRDVLAELEVRPFLNAAGTYTRLTASRMSQSVLDAMQVAATQYVDLQELHEQAGDRIAGLLECEAALVTAGCASAITLGTAACVAGSSPDLIRNLPDTSGMKNEVVLQKSHRNSYDHAVRNCGVRLVEVESASDLQSAINDRTAMLFFLNHAEHDGAIGHEEFVRIGKERGVPTLNDAAADVPPPDNLFRFTKMGYDLVAYSGGKGLLGPQSAGLLIGRRDLIEAARLNNNPNSDSVGRTNKVNKEEIVGMLVALEEFLARDHDEVWKEWEERCRKIGRSIANLPGLTTEIFVPEIANAVPHLRIHWDFDAARLTAEEAAEELRQGDPAIEVRPKFSEGLEVAVWMLAAGEERVVGRQLRRVLAKALKRAA